TLVPIEREVYSEDGRWYLTRFLPYRTVEDRIDGVVITFVDVTELKRAQQEVQRRVQQQAAVAMLGRLALEDVELDSLFNEAAKQVCETLEVEFSEVLELQPDEEALLLKAGQGWDENDIGQVVTQAGEKPSAGFALHRNEPHLVEEWRREKRFKLPDHLAERGIVSSASVVIPGLRQPYGVLRAHSRQKRSFSQEEVNFLQAVATLLAEAIERKQSELRLKALNETLEERVRERTTQVRTLASQLISTEQQVRQRISQVLHEDLQQLLFATQVHVQLVKDDLAAGKKKLSPGQVDEVKNMIEEGLRITRRLSIDLSPPVLQSQNFGESLKWLVHHMRELHGLEVKLTMKKVPEPPGDDMHLLLFQMVREALFNVVKHAGINQAELRAFAQGDDLVVQVIDEGAGFDVAAALKANSSYGLRHMRERLRLFGGRMDIESSPGQGTTITIAIPQRRVESLVD
ncbi:MAG: GAF domain-containing protein, partial [Chloroflexi bacterium]|nr:GAF domain-containing protein [Chloroflexota bacterium]